MCGAQSTLDGATATGPGGTVDLGVPRALHTMIVTATGGPNAGVTLEFSHDGTVWASQSGASGSTFPLHVHTERVARYVRANLVTLTGGSSPTVSATIASV